MFVKIEDISSNLCYNMMWRGEMKSIAFFGHRIVFNKESLEQKLIEVLKEVVPQGFSRLLIGCHGDFDKIALSSCLFYRKNIDQDVNIAIVLTNLFLMQENKNEYSRLDYYKNNRCETFFTI